MDNNLPLQGELVIFTSTKKSEEPYDLVRQYGGEAVSLPLIKTVERSDKSDERRLLQSQSYDWLIFTSQSAVASFQAKLQRYRLKPDAFSSRIAAVGEKTANALRAVGFTVDFIPDVFSADVFVQQFNPQDDNLSALFIKGNLAGTRIREELALTVDEWIVYETIPELSSVEKITHTASNANSLSILFASPSAVKVFVTHITPRTGWDGYTIGAIGHITEKALKDANAPVHVMPEVYTLPELVNSLAEWKGRKTC